MKKKVWLVVGLILICLLFFTSAITKWINISNYELQLYSSGLIPWEFNELFSRIIIIIELTIGGWILVATLFFGQKLPLKTAFILVSFFSFFLLIQLIFSGNQEDCGCFGGLIETNSYLSLVKNLVTLLLCYILIKSSPNNHLSILKKVSFYVGIGIVAITSTMISHPINSLLVNSSRGVQTVQFSSTPLAELEPKLGSTSIIVVASYTCKHCKRLVKKMNSWKKTKLIDDFTIVSFPELKSGSKVTFLSETEFEGKLYESNKDSVFSLTRGAVPKVYVYDNGELTGPWSGGRFSPEFVQN